MNGDKVVKITVVSALTFLLISILGLTYAYFSLKIVGTGKNVVMSTANLRLEYKDETELKLDGAFPGESISKTITVKNVGTEGVKYSLYWSELINTIENFELHVTLNCKSYTNYGETTQTESGSCDSIYRAVPIINLAVGSEMNRNIKSNISIEPNITHEYTVTVKFNDKNYVQNYNKKKSFNGKIGIEEYRGPSVTNCTYDGEVTTGTTYTTNNYTYVYNKDYVVTNENEIIFDETDIGGWHVELTNKDSTSKINENVCTYINDKPVVSMSYMFRDSKATTIDVSSFNTSNVINMQSMFNTPYITSIVGLNALDTSNVTNMSNMFERSKISSLDLSSFDTSNVTNMQGMFHIVNINYLDTTSLNTGKVTDMSYMFGGIKTNAIDVSGFDTSNVTNMKQMFQNAKVDIIDLNGFNAGNVTDMTKMFDGTMNVKIINLENINSINVTSMHSMFEYSSAEIVNINDLKTDSVIQMGYMFAKYTGRILDLSNFNTAKVKYMPNMFQSCSNLETIYVSSKFVLDNVTYSNDMFYGDTNLVGGAGTKFDSTNIDKTYAKIDGGTSSPGYFTLKSN